MAKKYRDVLLQQNPLKAWILLRIKQIQQKRNAAKNAGSISNIAAILK